MTNMLLHNIDQPSFVRHDNTLAKPLISYGPADRVESRDSPYHARVREGFLAEARRRPDRIVVVDASRPIEQVQQRICQEVERVVAARPRA